VTTRSEVYDGGISWGHAVLVQGNDVYVYGNHEIDGWTNTTYSRGSPSAPAVGRGGSGTEGDSR
jgi:hypothetical protein